MLNNDAFETGSSITCPAFAPGMIPEPNVTHVVPESSVYCNSAFVLAALKEKCICIMPS
jgi:hypothetical protein